MSEEFQRVSVRGKQRVVPAMTLDSRISITITGSVLKVGRIFDEFWIESAAVPEPEAVLSALRRARARVDLFTFAQKMQDPQPRYPYRQEWDNVAIAGFGSYEEWFERKINKNARTSFRKSVREGLRAQVVAFSDELVEGIRSIYNESDLRQGRHFWHFGKSFAEVKAENSSYLERSLFVGVYSGSELVGFLKLVLDEPVAKIMQILSKAAYFRQCPTNALLAKAVELCAARGVRYLSYGEWDSGKREQSSLIDFKRHNGFEKVLIPRYYCPLTLRGRLFLGLGLHRGWRALIPSSVWSLAVALRAKWHALRPDAGRARAGA